ncbi:MAG: holo-ACP synthase [Spirochaetales bacterium]|nr:holo-ACP synthase [Spirochaetales bacterium]
MILGLGIDIVDAGRIKKWQESAGLLERYFSDREIDIAKKKGKDYMLSLAARFAAKEAFGKALGTGLADIRLRDIAVENNERGKPVLVLTDTAQKAFNDFGGGHLHISLTHEKNNAVAVVIIEGD